VNRPRTKYTDEELAAAVAASPNIRQVLIALGLADRGGNYETIRSRIAAVGLDTSHMRRLKRKWLSVPPDNEIADAVEVSRSFSQVMAKLGMSGDPDRAEVKRRVQAMEIDTSHFLGQGWRKGTHAPTSRRPLEEFLLVGRLVKTHHLKSRLIEAGLKERRCEICSLTTWNGKPIPLELDHQNGRRDDNRLGNLRLLCPNCHAQTPTYRGRNIGAVERVS